MLSIFSCVCQPSVCFLWRNVHLVHFLIESCIFLVLSCMSCLYILELNSLSVASFAIIVSHSEGYLFTLLIVFFIVQKLLSLIRSHLFIFVFISLLWVVGHRGSYCNLCQRLYIFLYEYSSFSCIIYTNNEKTKEKLRKQAINHCKKKNRILRNNLI